MLNGIWQLTVLSFGIAIYGSISLSRLIRYSYPFIIKVIFEIEVVIVKKKKKL